MRDGTPKEVLEALAFELECGQIAEDAIWARLAYDVKSDPATTYVAWDEIADDLMGSD